MNKRYDRAFILCPTTLTGGPEALHQICQLMNEEGIDTRLAYYGSGAKVRCAEGMLSLTASVNNPCLFGYAKYNPSVAVGEHQLNNRTLIILPEVIGWHAEHFKPAKVAVWWLSVDNAFHAGSPLQDEMKRRAFFADSSIYHFCQTSYAKHVLERHGVTQTFDLVDYTDDLFTSRPTACPNDGSLIAFNPKKGASLAESFFSANRNLEPRRIEKFDKRQIFEIFTRTRLYVEFGHNPGKDRMPREAACSGCIVIARRAGGTAYFDDVPLPDHHKFSEHDVQSGRLAALLAEIQLDPGPFWEQQAYYRRYLFSEYELMRLQVKRLFGRN